jgi:hypothetical protein
VKRPVLLLLPGEEGRAAHERRSMDVIRDTDGPGGVAHAGRYAAVLVLNDGGAGTMRRLRLALALRDRHPQLQIGVLKYLGNGPVDPVAGRQACRADLSLVLAELGSELKVELTDQVLSLEYQAV